MSTTDSVCRHWPNQCPFCGSDTDDPEIADLYREHVEMLLRRGAERERERLQMADPEEG